MPVRGDETEPMMNIIAWRKGMSISLWSFQERNIVLRLILQKEMLK